MDKDPQNNNERLTRQQYRQQQTTGSNDGEEEQQLSRSRADQKIEQEQLTSGAEDATATKTVKYCHY